MCAIPNFRNNFYHKVIESPETYNLSLLTEMRVFYPH